MKSYNGRWLHIYKLWKNALSQESFPQFDRWLSNEFAKNSKYGSKDRRWYSEVLFAAVRHGYFALFCNFLYSKTNNKNYAVALEEFGKKYSSLEEIFNGFKTCDIEDFFTWVSLRYHISQLSKIFEDTVVPAQSDTKNDRDFDDINSIPQNKKEFFLNLITHLQNTTSYAEKLLLHSVPLWFLDYLNIRIKFSNLKQEEINKFLLDLDTRPPLWVRLNHLEKKEEVIQELQKENYEVESFNNSLKVTGAKGIFSLNSYRNGLFEIQDLASQKIGAHIKAGLKQYVWDCCAGGGGKTLQIASVLKNKGVIYASDIREYKLDEVKKRAKKAGFFNIRCLTWEGEALPNFQKEIQIKGGFDWVLVDAPCSSTGTWRRNPDAKYRAHQNNIKNLTALQLSILQHASKALVKGGHLVYSTCSWIVEENESVVEQFLQGNSEFSLIEQNLLGNPFANADTMFAAVMKKRS